MKRLQLPGATVLAALVLPILWSSCDKKAPADDVLAVVGGQPIRTVDLLGEAARLKERGRPAGAKEELLESMIGSRRLLEFAKLRGIDQDPAFIKAVDNLLIGTLKEKELTPAIEGVTVSEEDLRAEYLRTKESLVLPPALRFSMIAVNVPERATEERRTELRGRIEAAHALAMTGPAGFRDAAAKFSDDQASRYRGGDLGWNVAGDPHARLTGDCLKAGHALAADGDCSEIVETPSGYYLIKRSESRGAAMPPFEQVSDRLRSGLLKARRQAAQEAFEAKVAAAVGVERFPSRLEAIQLENKPADAADRPPANP